MTPKTRRATYPNGWRRHTVAPCDEPDGSRTWDVWRFGCVVEQGFRTRRLARARAASLDAVERGAWPLEHDRAHEMADTACQGGDLELALALLRRAERPGVGLGLRSSARTANRILNLKERLAKRAS
jgi:hypothetical protein